MDKRLPTPAKRGGSKVPSRDPRLTLRRQVFKVAAFAHADEERFELDFYEGILLRDPCNEDALMALGHMYTRCGDYEKGLAIDRRLARLRPEDPTVYYNLACSHS